MASRKRRIILRVGQALLMVGAVFSLYSFLFTDAQSFVRGRVNGIPFFWPQAQTSLNLRLGCPATPLLNWGPCWDDAAMDAAARWNNAAVQFRFFIRSPTVAANPCTHGDGINTAAFASTICGMAFGNALAVTALLIRPSNGELIDTDVLFNQGRQWSTYSGPLRLTTIDFHRVALHEFGHVLGLSHPDEHGQNVISIMNSRVSNLDGLQSDDILGVNTIYPDVTPDTGLGSNDHCQVAGPCGVGQGDCDSDQECQSGLVCVNDVGANYGFRPIVDVCEAP